VEYFLKKASSPIPYTVVLFYIGIIIAATLKACDVETNDYVSDSKASSNVMLFGLLPPLLFKETMHINL
jgi:hypothetical protein